MSRSFSESPPPVELTSCGTQALASSHSPRCRHLLKYSNRSWREVWDSQPKGCMATFDGDALLCSAVTTGEAPLLPYRQRGRSSFLHLKRERKFDKGKIAGFVSSYNLNHLHIDGSETKETSDHRDKYLVFTSTTHWTDTDILNSLRRLIYLILTYLDEINSGSW